MKFNVICGNPPFQDNETKNKTQHKIWPTFTQKALDEWLEDGGTLLWISPYSWGSPSNKILTLLKENQFEELNLDTSEYFPNVGSTFSNYRITKGQSPTTTSVTKDGSQFNMSFDDVFYIPNDVCATSMSIHSKVMFGNANTFDLKYDYVTCHNVIRHAKKLHEKKIEKVKEKLTKDVNEEKTNTKAFSKNLERLESLIQKRSIIDISVSEVKTNTHVHPVFHTNNKTWYSSKLQDFASKKKVMWSRSGYVKPFYDDGKLGCTDMGYYILVDSDDEGRRLVDFLSSDLMKYVFKTAKWSGFGNELVFSAIPKIDLSKDMTLKDYYKKFKITKSEQTYIDSILNPKKSKSSKKGSAETKSEFRIKKHGEVYTPKELVLNMLDSLPADQWEDPTNTFIDPACGNGNFIVEILTKRLDFGISAEDAIGTLYGIDILQDNINETKERMNAILLERGHNPENFAETMDNNIVLSNSLEHTMEEIFQKNLTTDC